MLINNRYKVTLLVCEEKIKLVWWVVWTPGPKLLYHSSPQLSILLPQQHRGSGKVGCGQFATRFYFSFLLKGRTPHVPPLLQHGVAPVGLSPP